MTYAETQSDKRCDIAPVDLNAVVDRASEYGPATANQCLRRESNRSATSARDGNEVALTQCVQNLLSSI